MSNGNFSEFYEALGQFESGIDPTNTNFPESWLHHLRVFEQGAGNVDPNSVDITNPDDLAMLQYHVHNTIGFVGKYQFGEALLIDLGYYSPAASGYYPQTASNEWLGTFTGKNGVYSKEDFMSEVQELAIREAMSMNMGIIETYLGNAGKTLDDFMGQEFTYTRLGETHTGTVNMSGILAGAHLQGPGGVANFLLQGVVSHDEYGTNILFYMDKFGGYDTPFGTHADDTLVGSDYSETFDGKQGHNTYETGDGADKIILNDNINGSDLIIDFDLANDVMSLSAFPGVVSSDLNLSQSGNDAIIQLPNGQSVTLQNTDASLVAAHHFVYGPYKVTWDAGSGDQVLDNFNLEHDLIDLNYAFNSANLALYEENGSSVLDIVGNNQRVILQDIPLNELSAFHFIKAPHDFAQVFFGDGVVSEPPPVDDPVEPPADDDPVIDPPDPVEPPLNGDTYSFTWDWGARDVISNFDPSSQTIDLHNFWSSYDQMSFYNDADGNAVIDLMDLNNQSITLNGVSIDELSGQNFIGINGVFNAEDTPPAEEPVDDPVVEPPTEEPVDEPEPEPDPVEGGNTYAYTWNWGSVNTIDQFDVSSDVIDLQGFWTDYSSFDIYQQNNDLVIDLSSINNQSIIIQNTSLDDFSSANISGVNGIYSDALSDNVNPPADDPVDEPGDNTTHDGSNSDLIAVDNQHDVFEFTWNWGKQSVIENFNVSEDTVDLHLFWTNAGAVDIHDDADGNAVIDLTNLNNQTITLLGVSSNELDNENLLF